MIKIEAPNVIAEGVISSTTKPEVKDWGIKK